MHRFFVEDPKGDREHITITGGDVNHIKNVLRMNVGEKLCIVNGQDNREYLCEITSLFPDAVETKVCEVREADQELESRITLFQGLPKSDKMELIIQKAVELGVYEIVPMQTDRAVVKLDAKKEQNKQKRWSQIAESAAKQSGRLRIPQITRVMSMKEALAYAKQMDVKLIPYELAEGMDQTRALLGSIRPGQSVAVFIGPEGGFERSEVEKAQGIGAQPITLGKRILRTETAGLVTLAMLVYNLER